MSEANAELQDRIARLTRAVGGKFPPKLSPPPKIEEKPSLSRYEQLLAEEEYEKSLLPKPNYTPAQIKLHEELRAKNLIQHELETARLREIQTRDLARASIPMASYDSDLSFDTRKGQPAPLGINFVPFIAVTKWCYTFAPSHLLQRFASAFFDADKIYARDWDL